MHESVSSSSVRRFRVPVVLAAAAAAALVSAGPAAAHAFLVRSIPASGSVVPAPPREVRLVFDEGVQPAPGITVVRAGGHSVVAGKPFVPPKHPNEIVIPLQQGLGTGPYAVHWSELDVDDGHVISGAFIFAVGSGSPQVAAAASAGASAADDDGGPPLSVVVSRWLLLAGLLVAAGVVGFSVLVVRSVSRELVGRRSETLVLAAALGLAALGAILGVVLEPGSTSTRFGRWTLIGACVAGVAGAAALASLRERRLRLPAAAAAVALLGLPTATGHASAADVPHAISIPADLVHLAAAAFWIGGVLELALLVPRGDAALRRALVRRFTPYAVAAVALLGASGVVRAYNELDSFHQLWTTGYGQALLVKTGIFAGLLALAFVNRVRLPRAGVRVELALLAVVVGAVAVLTNVRPGLAHSILATPQSSTVVLAAQDDDLAVGLALTPREDGTLGLRATVLGQNGPAAGLEIAFGVQDGAAAKRARAKACGAGCYAASLAIDGAPRALTATVARPGGARRTIHLAGPVDWPAPQALEIVRAAERAIGGLRSLVVHSRLASDSTHEVTTIYRMVAPDRLAYHNVGGSDTVIIGDKRWDRDPGAQWMSAPQWPPIRQPAPFWPTQITDAHVLRTARVDGRPVWVVSFLDQATPAWFTVWIDRSTFRTLRLEMIAAAHFMHDRDGPFDAPISVEPPGA